ncbi:MAG TPA: DUF72 domain-containing protein [Gemmataceae bacterium]|nr:DUF72 domain-containing protein [Gemmataceae bacterium]
MNFYVGTSGYSYKEWKGSFYPEKLAAKKMLGYYGQHFQTVEINYTFRRMPTESVLQNWADQVPAEFQFALKAPEQITHRKRLIDAGDALAYFTDVAVKLKARLGPLLFQLPPNFKKDVPRLSAFLEQMPKTCRAAFEFRHASWFDDEVFALLRKSGVALCIADESDDLKVPFVATAGWGCLRLRRPEYSDAELKAWLKQIREQDWDDVYLYFRHEDEARGPRFAKAFLDLVK